MAQVIDIYILAAAGFKGKEYPIVCIKPYEFEGRELVKGEISWQCWGRNIPKYWGRATADDIRKWRER